jgi:hypothetical protein
MKAKLRDAHKRDQRIVAAYVKAATAVFPRHFNPDCCLNGTRVAIEVLDEHFGIPCEPVPCRMFVGNKIAADLIDAHPDAEPDEATQLAWRAAGAWMIVVDGALDESGYGRHLICVAAGTMVDSAFGQFHRPQHGILAPLVIAGEVGSSFRREGKQFVGASDGSFAIYTRDDAEVAAREYATLSGFQRSGHNLEVAAAVIAAMGEL